MTDIRGWTARGWDGADARSVGDLVAAFLGPDSPLAQSLDAPGGAFGDPEIWSLMFGGSYGWADPEADLAMVTS